MATKDVSIRLSVQDAEKVKAALRSIGAEGNKMADRLEQAGSKPNGPMLALSNTVAGLRTQLASFAAAYVSLEGLRAVRTIISDVAELGRVSQQLGIPVEKLQQLQAVAASARVDAGELRDMLEEFSAISSEAAQGQGDMFEILKANNVQLRDQKGNMRPVME